MSDYIIKTERLGIRNWKDADHKGMIAVSASEEVMRYFPSTSTPEQTIAFIGRMKKLYAKRGYCYYAVELLENREFIGFIGLCYQDYDVDFAPFIDIGWRLKESAWGKGYATEGAKACLEHGLETLKIEKIYAVASHVNVPSINVMKKIGMEKSRDFIHPKLVDYEHLKDCVLYVTEKEIK